LSQAAEALVADSVDVIAALTHVTAFAAQRVTKTIPIVMIASGGPVKTGLVSSLSRPGANVTGLTYYSVELVEKRLQLIKELVPAATHVGNRQSDHVFGVYRADAERAVDALGLKLVKAEASHPLDLDASFAAMVEGGAEALLVLTDPMLNAQARRIVELAGRHRLPAIYWGPSFVEAGGLAAYSADFASMTRRAADYVDRLLRGAKPADLPVEQPTRFSFVLNLKTANALGLTIPPALLARADEVIE
jgi:putative ABC transport system substrate-binding protein